MPINKVIYGTYTLIDISDSTVIASVLGEGYVAYDAAGNRIIGTMQLKTVDHISADFVQGDSEFYSTSSLESLKELLTVYAYYTDGTYGTVTGYNLTGTLEVGTSAVTVEYEGHTDDFDVIVSELSYVKSGLYEYFDFMNESKYTESTYSQLGELGVFSMKRSAATWGNSKPSDISFSAYNGIAWRSNSYNFANVMTVANGYSIEMLLHNDKANYAASSGSANAIMDSNNQYGRQFILQNSGSYHYAYYKDADGEQVTYRLTTSLTSGSKPIMPSGKEWSHIVVVQTEESISVYQNGALIMKLVYANQSDFGSIRYATLQGMNVMNTSNQFHMTKMRYYSKALTAEEVKNNYDYETTLV